MKRKAESEISSDDNNVRPTPAKKQNYGASSSPVAGPSNIHGFSNIKQESASSSGCPMSFRGGAIRITRTPGRTNDKNTVSLPDIIKKQHLVSACIFSFFNAQDELFQHLPLSRSSTSGSTEVPIYIGRDPPFDPYVRLACQEAELNIKGKITNKQLEQIKPELRRLYKKDYGSNFNAFYAWCSGSSHTKILVLVYPTFLRLAITSKVPSSLTCDTRLKEITTTGCNMMNIDTVLGDNHWYIHDLPKRSTINKSLPQGFEADLLAHLSSLNTPDAFLDNIRGVYDYSSVKVHLITSIPGTFSGAKANKHGLLRLRSVIKDLGLKLPKMEDEGKLEVEVCAASIGNLKKGWLDAFYDCALGRKTLEMAENEDDIVVPKMKIVYPTVQDVKRCYAESQQVKAHPSRASYDSLLMMVLTRLQAASNIGCHTRPWDKAPRSIQELFYHYRSTDDRRLHHQKFICAFNTSSSFSLPYYIYIGSANLSQSAWGGLEVDKKGNKDSSDMKLVKVSNYECGVLVPGEVLMELLEPGTKDWKRAIIPYARPLQPYK